MTDPVAAYLNEVRERYNAGADYPLAGNVQAITDSSDDVPRLVAALDGVAAVHQKLPGGPTDDGYYCRNCGGGWPCATYRAISRALQGEESTNGPG
jgi:hypothetical protein